MEYKVLFPEEINRTFLPKIMEIDRKCYPDEYVGELSQMEARYDRNPNTFVCVMDQDTIAGYINFFPVQPQLWEEITETGMEIRDDDILPEELADYSKEEPNNLFIISVAIQPEYRGKKVIKLLTDGFIEYLNKLEARGFTINAISGTAVSEDGQKFLRNCLFGECRELEDGNKVYICDGVYLRKFLNNKLYFKTYRDDVYLFLPFVENEKNTKIAELLEQKKTNQKAPEHISHLLEALDNCLEYEYQSDVVNELERVYLGEFNLLHTLDEYPESDDERPHVVGEETVYISLLAHRLSHMYVVMLVVPESKYSTSQLEDQVCQKFLRIRKKEDKDEKGFYQYTDLYDYLKNQYGLLECGSGKSIICMSQKPENETEFFNILTAETYNSMHQDFHITYAEVEECAKNNKSIYDYYEAYMTEVVVAFILKDFNNLDLKERMDLTATYVFIVEMVMFQNIALSRVTGKVSNALAHEGEVSYDYINQLNRDYAKTIKFWQSNNFKYYGTQREAEQIRRAFENDDLKVNFREQQDFLEHMVDVKNARSEYRNGTILNFVLFILTIVQVRDYLIELLNKFYEKIGVPLESADSTFNVLLFAGVPLAVIIWYTLNRKRYYTSQKKLSRNESEKNRDE